MNAVSVRLLLSSVVFLATMGVSQADLLDGLVGYYSYESDFTNDASASGPDGTGVNGATAGASGGIVGNAMLLNTVDEEGGNLNQHMNTKIRYGGGTANAADDLGANFTVSTWYNLNSPPKTNGSSRYFVYEGEVTFDVSYGTRDSGVGVAGINDGQVFVANSDSGGANNIVIADAAVAGWHHVLQTYEVTGGTAAIVTTYIDGTNIGTLDPTASGVVDSGMNFGAPRSSTTNRGFDGLIDESALWNRVLDANEISAVYQAGLDGIPLQQANVIPEPTAFALGLGGLIALVVLKRK